MQSTQCKCRVSCRVLPVAMFPAFWSLPERFGTKYVDPTRRCCHGILSSRQLAFFMIGALRHSDRRRSAELAHLLVWISENLAYCRSRNIWHKSWCSVRIETMTIIFRKGYKCHSEYQLWVFLAWILNIWNSWVLHLLIYERPSVNVPFSGCLIRLIWAGQNL